jgi:hypothetical protein
MYIIVHECLVGITKYLVAPTKLLGKFPDLPNVWLRQPNLRNQTILVSVTKHFWFDPTKHLVVSATGGFIQIVWAFDF